MMYTRAHRAGCEQGYQDGRQEGREEGRQEGHQEGHEKGRLATQARLVLALLEQRGLAIPRRVRMRVLECGDSAQLDRWFVRAVHVDRADALLLDE